MRVDVSGSSAFVHTGGVEFDRSRPTVLLIHGAGQDHTHFRFVTRALAHRGLAVLALDLPGHGQSGGEPCGSIEAYGEGVLAVLDVLDVHGALLVGHSMGSLVAIQAAADAPDRAAGIVLTGTGDSMPVHPDLLKAAAARDPLAVELIGGWTHTGYARFGGHPQAGSWMRGVTERVLEREISSLGSDLAACAAHETGVVAKGVVAPVTIIVGSADAMTRPRRAYELAAVLPDVEVRDVAGVGHDVVVERPEVVISSVVDMVKRAFGP